MKDKIAVFVCGSGGSGKTTFSDRYFSSFKKINVDIPYEKLLKGSGMGVKITDFSEDQAGQASKFFESAKDISYNTFLEAIAHGDNIVIDTVGRYIDSIRKQRKKLNINGYKTIMFMLYAPLDVCINRVKNRDRTYDESVTIDSWYLSYGNITNFKTEFLDDFHLLYNDETFSIEEKIPFLLKEKIMERKNKYL